MPSAPIAVRKNAAEDAAAARADVPRGERMRGEGPVGQPQYRRGPLIGHQVGEGRQEPPQFRGLHRAPQRPHRLPGGELSHPMTTE